MSDFTDDELAMLSNSAHERAMNLLDLYGMCAQKGYNHYNGEEVTAEELERMYQAHLKCLALVVKIRELRGKQDGSDS